MSQVLKSRQIFQRYSLHELPHPAFTHDWVISPIYLSNLPNLVLRYVSAKHREVSCEWNSVIVSQRKLFSSLIHQVEYEFRVFPVFVGEDVFALEDRCVEACAAVGGEAVFKWILCGSGGTSLLHHSRVYPVTNVNLEMRRLCSRRRTLAVFNSKGSFFSFLEWHPSRLLSCP
jgi:hypothetical protein